MSHELRWSWKRQGLVIAPTHPLDEAAGCGWVGEQVDDYPAALNTAAVAAGWDPEVDGSIREWLIESGDGEIRADGHIYMISSEGDLCVITGWCSFQRDSFMSTADAIESADWAGAPDAEVVLAQVDAWEQESDWEYPQVTKLAPVEPADASGAEWAEVIVRRLLSAGCIHIMGDQIVTSVPAAMPPATSGEIGYLTRLAESQADRDATLPGDL